MAVHLDLHAIHSIPVANLNADMSRMPKTAVFGGVQRARVSSQAWNYAIRQHLIEQGHEPGVRTRDILTAVAAKDQKAALLLGQLLAAKTNKVLPFDAKAKQLKSAYFFTTGHLDALVEWAKSEPSDINGDLARILTGRDHVNLDVALFGSTLTSHPAANIRATSSAMHSLSTHEITLGFDEFVGTDDTSDLGGAHVGVRDFMSATFYRFSTINVTSLLGTVGPNRVSTAVEAFMRAFAEAVPVGGQTSLHSATRPDFMAFAVRDGRPESYVNAFETPVVTDGGLVDPSIDAFLRHHDQHIRMWGEPREFIISTPREITGRSNFSFAAALDEIVTTVAPTP